MSGLIEKKIVGLFYLKFTHNVDRDEMLHDAAFHSAMSCLKSEKTLPFF